jgi:hypothetical protein
VLVEQELLVALPLVEQAPLAVAESSRRLQLKFKEFSSIFSQSSYLKADAEVIGSGRDSDGSK